MARVMQKPARFMKHSRLKIWLAVTTLGVVAPAVSAAESAPAPLPADTRAATKAPEKGQPKALPATATDVEKLREQLDSRRAAVLSERTRLLEQLKTATEEQRRAIFAKMQEQQDAFVEAAREMAKQARDDARKQRQTSPAASGGRRN